MTMDEFWGLTERTHEASDGDPEKQRNLLIEELVEMPIEEIFDYQRIHDQLENESYRTEIWNVAYIIGQGCGNDSFDDFRCWLIAQGKSVFERTLRDPDSLADYVSVERRFETQWEGLLYVAAYAYQEKLNTEDWIPLEGTVVELSGSVPLTGDPSELKALYPKTWAKFGQ
jgi:hypothetical protein